MDRISALRNVEDALAAFEAEDLTLPELEREVRGVLRTYATDFAEESRAYRARGDPPADGVAERTRDEAIAAAMADTAGEIDDEGYETYGDYNRTAVDHPFGLSFLNYPRLPTDGSPHTVRNFRKESSVGSSFRFLARFDDEPSLGMIPGGNDGEYFSDHYSDQIRAWADAEYRPIRPTTRGEPTLRFESPDSGDIVGSKSDPAGTEASEQ